MILNKTKTLLEDVELQLRIANLWSQNAPSAQALASSVPFACDVMPFEHWLQYIFLPKMHQLLACHSALPANISLTPMAEHVWSGQQSRQALIDVLQQLDILLNASR